MAKKINPVPHLRLLAEVQGESLPHTAKLYTAIADELEALRAESKRLKAQERDHIVLMRPADAARIIGDYGQLAELFTAMKARGWDKAGIDYVRARVWFE